MWLKACPVCSGKGNVGVSPDRVPCSNCQGLGGVPSADPADQYNEIDPDATDLNGDHFIVNKPPSG